MLTDYELATRAALTLWGRAPDAALLDRVEAGALRTPQLRRQLLAEMLDDARAWEGLRDLAGEWFHLDVLDAVQLDPERYPRFHPAMTDTARAEAERLLHDHLLGGRPYPELFTAPYGYADPALAEVYGVSLERPVEPSEALTDDGLVRVQWQPEHERAGLLGTAAVLMLTSSAKFPSPVRRGLFVREAVLCDRPPPPPPEVEVAEQDDADALDAHASDPACSGCHERLDPVGWGLDRYDAMGALRDVDELGDPVREEGYVLGLDDGDPAVFGGVVELGERVADSDKVGHCAASNTLRWALGRAPGERSRCALDDLQASFAATGHDYRALLVEILASELFTERVVPEDP